MENKRALDLIWRAGVDRVNGHTATINAIRETRLEKPDAIIAIGKAATPMLEAALSFAGYDTNSLLITKYGHIICHHRFNQDRIEEYQNDGTLKVIEAGHPVPDKNSIRAGKALIEFVGQLPKDEHLLLLVSGGASALAEALPDNLTLAQWQQQTETMLSDGLDISAINEQRKKISLIKDGRLLANIKLEQVTTFAISDVQGDELAIIGSGIGLTSKLASSTRSRAEIMASNSLARQASAEKASLMGYEICHNEEDAYGNVEDVADHIIKRINAGSDGVYIFGGEPTVTLPRSPGKGGRNQHLALLLAKKLSGSDNIQILVGGTDGTDGPGDAAGGYAEGSMFSKNGGGEDALKGADSGSFLQRCDRLFVTGPTGTNVMDLIIAIKGS